MKFTPFEKHKILNISTEILKKKKTFEKFEKIAKTKKVKRYFLSVLWLETNLLLLADS